MKNVIFYATQHSNDRLDVRVKFEDERIYKVSFCSTKYLTGELKDTGVVAIPGLIILDKVSMGRVREVISDVVASGYFEHLKPEGE